MGKISTLCFAVREELLDMGVTGNFELGEKFGFDFVVVSRKGVVFQLERSELKSLEKQICSNWVRGIGRGAE